MKVGIIGVGYVGLPTGVGLAELGHEVICIDREISKIETLQNGKITLYEEGLEDLLIKNINSGNIHFTTSMEEGIKNTDIVIIAVGTPTDPITKETNMEYIYGAATELAGYLKKYTIVAIKSTVPVGTGDEVESLIAKQNPKANFDVISLPEFLREGFAVYDFFNPDRIVVGTNSEKVKNIIKEFYKAFENKTKMLFVKRRSSEIIKYASNAFLATKIHYINEMANFCEKFGVSICEVAEGMGLDNRIGNRFLNAGPGYGGSCFPKDTMAMASVGKKYGVDLTLINATINGNNERKKQMAYRILETVKNIPNAKITVLGLAFKNGTDDCRESPSIEIISELLKNKVNITVYDPKVQKTAKEILGDKVSYADDMYTALENADVLAILTAWDEFRSLDFGKVAKLMRTKKIIDCHNLLNSTQAKEFEFEYKGIGV